MDFPRCKGGWESEHLIIGGGQDRMGQACAMRADGLQYACLVGLFTTNSWSQKLLHDMLSLVHFHIRTMSSILCFREK